MGHTAQAGSNSPAANIYPFRPGRGARTAHASSPPGASTHLGRQPRRGVAGALTRRPGCEVPREESLFELDPPAAPAQPTTQEKAPTRAQPRIWPLIDHDSAQQELLAMELLSAGVHPARVNEATQLGMVEIARLVGICAEEAKNPVVIPVVGRTPARPHRTPVPRHPQKTSALRLNTRLAPPRLARPCTPPRQTEFERPVQQLALSISAVRYPRARRQRQAPTHTAGSPACVQLALIAA